MSLRPFALSLLVTACGGSEAKPAETATPAPAAPTLSASDGGAVAGDPYAGFDAGTIEEPGAAAASAPPAPAGGDLGAECRTAAAAWEKRARPQIKACYREGKKKDPNLMGTARIVVDVAYDGKVKPAKLDGTSSLGDDVAACMVKAVSATPFPDAAPCRTRQLTVPVEFPTPP
jgi:hypothetical protein